MNLTPAGKTKSQLAIEDTFVYISASGAFVRALVRDFFYLIVNVDVAVRLTPFRVPLNVSVHVP